MSVMPDHIIRPVLENAVKELRSMPKPLLDGPDAHFYMEPWRALDIFETLLHYMDKFATVASTDGNA